MPEPIGQPQHQEQGNTRHSVPPDEMQGKRHKPPQSALVSVTEKSQVREQPSLYSSDYEP